MKDWKQQKRTRFEWQITFFFSWSRRLLGIAWQNKHHRKRSEHWKETTFHEVSQNECGVMWGEAFAGINRWRDWWMPLSENRLDNKKFDIKGNRKGFYDSKEAQSWLSSYCCHLRHPLYSDWECSKSLSRLNRQRDIRVCVPLPRRLAAQVATRWEPHSAKQVICYSML